MVYKNFLAVEFLLKERLSLQIEVQRCVNEKTRSHLVSIWSCPSHQEAGKYY